MAERLFGTDGLRGPVNIYPMTVDVALRLGLAAGVRFRKGSHQSSARIPACRATCSSPPSRRACAPPACTSS